MKRWLSFIFLLLTAFSGPAITRQFAPVISDARGNVRYLLRTFFRS